MRVAIQGTRGSFSEAAARKQWPDLELLPLRTVADVVEAVRDGKADAGCLPFENSLVGLIERVLDNLIDNAIQHSPPGGVVTLRATRPGPDAIRFEVEDSGPGISGEEQIRIFDRFYRGDESRSAGTGSSGLGLAIVKGLLELHSTGINVDSRAGSGTRFSFELPIASQEHRAPR